MIDNELKDNYKNNNRSMLSSKKRSHKHFTHKEISIIILAFNNTDDMKNIDKNLSLLLDRSINSIIIKRSKLKLKKRQ